MNADSKAVDGCLSVADWHADVKVAKIISEYPGPILTYFTGLVGVFVRMIMPMFVWQSLKGRCYGNQLNLKDVLRYHQERPLGLLFASALDNRSDDRKSAVKRLNGNNPTTSFTNLVNFRPITSGVFTVKTHNFCRDLAAI